MIQTVAPDMISMKQKEKSDAVGTKVKMKQGKTYKQPGKPESPWKPMALGNESSETQAKTESRQRMWAGLLKGARPSSSGWCPGPGSILVFIKTGVNGPTL